MKRENTGHRGGAHPRSGRSSRDPNYIKRQAHAAEPETSQERIERVRAAAAVQIAHVYAGQPTKWTLIAEAMHWVLVRLERLVDHAELLS